MRKTYQLNIEGKHRDRVLDAIRHDIHKYVHRQRRVALPEGVDFWDFDCKVGSSAETATPVHFGDIMRLIDAVAKAGGDSLYLELLPKEGRRKSRPTDSDEATQG